MRRSFPKDPYWLTTKYACDCKQCHQPIQPGARGFYYPNTRTMLCDSDNCGKQADRDLAAAIQDERTCAL